MIDMWMAGVHVHNRVGATWSSRWNVGGRCYSRGPVEEIDDPRLRQRGRGSWLGLGAMERAFGLEIPSTLEEVCQPRRLALIVYDMQVGVLGQIENADAIAERVVEVLDAARSAGVRVVFVRHLSMPKELMGVFQLRMAMAWQRVDSVAAVNPWFLRGSPGFELIPELVPRATEAVFDKITMSAFEGTPVDIVLRDCGVNAFAIVGVATEVGIEPTVRHGADLGYIPVVVTDACGGGDDKAARRSMDSLEYTGDALFTDTATFCRLLRGQ
jgi:nicotinamidase-related amidase